MRRYTPGALGTRADRAPQLRTAVRYALNHLRPAVQILSARPMCSEPAVLSGRTGGRRHRVCGVPPVFDPEAAAIVDAAVAGLSWP